MKKANNIYEKFIDYIDDNLPKTDAELVENHLKNNKNDMREMAEIRQLFNVISSDTTDFPSKNLRLNFEKALLEEKLTTKAKVVQLEPKQNWKQYLRIVASIIVVVSAFLLGKYQANNSKLLANNSKEKKIITLLDNQLASKRIKAINLSSNIKKPNSKIIEALINKLFNDKNTNVRLASAEVLLKFSSSELVKNALIKALETDKEPAVQIELIRILGKIQDKRALAPMQEILEKEETPDFVKQELRYNISNLM